MSGRSSRWQVTRRKGGKGGLSDYTRPEGEGRGQRCPRAVHTPREAKVLWEGMKPRAREGLKEMEGYCNVLSSVFFQSKLFGSLGCPENLEKAEKPEIKWPTSTRSWKKQESSRLRSIYYFLLTWVGITLIKFLTLWSGYLATSTLQDIKSVG